MTLPRDHGRVLISQRHQPDGSITALVLSLSFCLSSNMNTIRHASLGFLGVVLQVVAVEAKRGGGGGKSKGGGKKGGLGGMTVGIIVGMRVLSLARFSTLTVEHSRCYPLPRHGNYVPELVEETVPVPLSPERQPAICQWGTKGAGFRKRPYGRIPVSGSPGLRESFYVFYRPSKH